MTKRQKVVQNFGNKLWEMGQKDKITYDEWSVIIGRLWLVLAKNFIEPTYNITYDAGKDKVSMKVRDDK